METLDIPDYDVWGRIGEGGMSQVWLAKHRALAVPVVVKTLLPSLAQSYGELAAARILSEARLMARIGSARVVRAIDAGRTTPGGIPFLVQEYVDGLDLAELDRRRRTALGVGLPLWFVCRAMREVCVGLRAAHHAGVIHRDLKPSNVFGTPETGIRLGDFGIAVARSDGPATDQAGTLRFMAPEQLRGDEVTRATDVWGAGATACDLRYGNAPFDSVEALRDPDRGPRMPEPSSPAEAYFQMLLRCMLDKDRRRRPEDLSAPLHHFTMLTNAVAAPPHQASKLDATTLMLGAVRVHFRVGDIAQAEADAIVSSANFELRMRSGVGDFLRRRGGDALEAEAMAGGEKPLGSCVRTSPGALSARHVFHAVSAWNEVSCIGRAFARALLMADEHGCHSLAVPALGTGAARIGTETCATAMMTTLRWHTMLGGMRMREITVWLDSEERRRVFQEIAQEALGLATNDRHLRAPDVGLPTAGTTASPEAATALDPGASGSGGSTGT